ncbi:MAG: PQQ-binding-like beta-propeller repeat protein [Planctomycetia bacterium]|jgi:outer membrane protein assembly factor BamB|nr:PQQ-binding-like beta-propeller repeat protein [Planctomycetia bacterium]MCC7314341.1 PQQ-binding-like beta-propeller repeat protein [Planctomycetota bacterium]OQZ06608.1 MAG: hypothetical protein B6D36_04120 [Planctomycetes bacterium UTPLA1]
MRGSVIESVLRRSIGIPFFLLAAVTLGCSQGSWTQWGGPNRDFSVGAAPIADKWPEGGPQKLWSRELGDGFSTIVSDGRTLFAMYRGEQDQECIAALDAASGKTLWEHKYAAPFIEFEVDEIDKETGKKRIEKQVTKFGTGPNSTPLLVGGRLFTLGYTGIFTCLDAATGKVNWSHDLYKDMGATYLRFGWATSPLAYGDNVIVLTGGKGHGVTSFKQATGEVAWQDRAAPGPKCINADGRLIVLDDDGNLMLIAANLEGMSVLSQTKLLESPSWTAPTLVGSKLYLRDRKVIMAMDLS